MRPESLERNSMERILFIMLSYLDLILKPTGNHPRALCKQVTWQHGGAGLDGGMPAERRSSGQLSWESMGTSKSVQWDSGSGDGQQMRTIVRRQGSLSLKRLMKNGGKATGGANDISRLGLQCLHGIIITKRKLSGEKTFGRRGKMNSIRDVLSFR